MTPRESITGIGGVFFKARDPKALAAWYRENLGIPVVGDGTYASLSVGEDGRDGTGAPLFVSCDLSNRTIVPLARFDTHSEPSLSNASPAGVAIDPETGLMTIDGSIEREVPSLPAANPSSAESSGLATHITP